MAKLFGTDGVRGLANKDLTAELALGLGVAAARMVRSNPQNQGRRLRAVVGRDTRISGEFLDHAITAGLASAGMDVDRARVVTTPTVAFLTDEGGYDLGVMISASHNPMPDNGIKFFAKGGYKLPDEVEAHIESLLGQEWQRPVGGEVGEVEEESRAVDKTYLAHLVNAVGMDLSGLRIAVDCANGAASYLGPEALRAAGADAVVINASPDGRNINDNCGSTHPQQLQNAVLSQRCDFGVAYDGDADRCLAVDHEGNLIDGDKIMGMLVLGMREEGKLPGNTLVVTVMSNLGLILAMKEAGIKTVQTAVGDRYVLEKMRECGYGIGGEQSGHVIISDYATTGDGVLTSLMIARRVKQTGKTLKELTDFIKRLPQTLINVPNVDKTQVGSNQVLQQAISQAEDQLGESGRVLLRPSGTEPLVRVMVEAATQSEADVICDSLATVVARELALKD
ncbi:MAG: phosphoglucosamine mutase [Actinomycetaceae bacterium]|nr:phosphoglucosamine mutase [Actinomycetaceae bacterium]